MAEIDGTCDERFEAVREAFAKNFDDGLEVGASVAVVKDGELVVDLWGGHTDEARTEPWQRDTIINVWSSTKTMSFLVALMLADAGELDFHAPVAKYWPEFAANGKEGVEVRHLMAHTSGLSGWDPPIDVDVLYDWDDACGRLAAQAPWWEPGTASGYHALTQGYLIGEVTRRVSGQSLGTFFAEQIAGPIGADFHIGTPAECDDRVALIIPPPPADISALDPESIAHRTLSASMSDATVAHTIPWRRAEIPAANGHGNARSVAMVQSAISHGGSVGDTRLLSPAGIETIFDVQAEGTDLVLGVPLRFGMGYGLNSEFTPLSPNPRACFWGGWGGSLVINDLDANMTIAYVMNKMGDGTMGDLRGAMVVMAAQGAVSAD